MDGTDDAGSLVKSDLMQGLSAQARELAELKREMEEMADQYFVFRSGWYNNRYMQSVAQCRYPNRFPAICHYDGTSRVQTVPKDGSGIRELLEKWFMLTDCPMLLNTSLNIKGEPIINDRADADRFESKYGVRVFS